LGRGLESLLPSRPNANAAASQAPAPARAPVRDNEIGFIPLNQIAGPNPNQPRRTFDAAALAELTESIRAQGVLQPIIVRQTAGGGYTLVAGERRFRAARAAGLEKIPALISNYGDAKAAEVALVENIQREDLNPIEQARAYQTLRRQFNLNQEEIAQKTGKDRATVANAMRLLSLEEPVIEMLERGELSPGHARPLVGLPAGRQFPLAQKIVAGHWTVRQVEQHVSGATGDDAKPEAAPKPPRDPNIRDAEEQLARALGARVLIKSKRKNRGTIEITYNDLEEFQRLYERLLPPA